MRVATLDLSPELFVEMCKGMAHGGGLSRRFTVKENPLPEDAKVERVGMDYESFLPTLRLFLSSERFDDVPDTAIPPRLPPVVFETIFDGETEQ